MTGKELREAAENDPLFTGMNNHAQMRVLYDFLEKEGIGAFEDFLHLPANVENLLHAVHAYNKRFLDSDVISKLVDADNDENDKGILEGVRGVISRMVKHCEHVVGDIPGFIEKHGLSEGRLLAKLMIPREERRLCLAGKITIGNLLRFQPHVFTLNGQLFLINSMD